VDIGMLEATWTSGTASAPPQSPGGLAGITVTALAMPLVEDDSVAQRSTMGVAMLRTSTAVNARASAAFQLNDADQVRVTLLVVPTQQVMRISVAARSNFSQLLASMLGLVSGLGAIYRAIFVGISSVKSKTL